MSKKITIEVDLLPTPKELTGAPLEMLLFSLKSIEGIPTLDPYLAPLGDGVDVNSHPAIPIIVGVKHGTAGQLVLAIESLGSSGPSVGHPGPSGASRQPTGVEIPKGTLEGPTGPLGQTGAAAIKEEVDSE